MPRWEHCQCCNLVISCVDCIKDSGARSHTLARSNAAAAFPTGCVLVLADEDSGPSTSLARSHAESIIVSAAAPRR